MDTFSHIESEPRSRDITLDYERIMNDASNRSTWDEFVDSLRSEQSLLLRVDLSSIRDKSEFKRKANFLKGFMLGETETQKRTVVVRATAEQRFGSDASRGTTYGWAEHDLRGVRWEE